MTGPLRSGEHADMRLSGASVPGRPLLSGLFHVVPLPPDRVQLCNAGRAVVLTGAGFAEQLPPLLESLDGTTSVEELAASFPDLVPEVLQGLASRGLLLDGSATLADSGVASRTAIAIPGAPPPAETAARLRDTTVALAASGAVSLSAGLCLARAGLGRLLVDDEEAVTSDAVAATANLPRDSTGRPADDVLREAICGIADTSVEGARDPLQADFVIAEQRYGATGLGAPAADAALAAGVPYLTHGQDALTATIGPAVPTGGTPCHRCVETRRLGNITHIDEHLAYLAYREAYAPAPDAFVAAHTSVVAGYLALDVIRALLGTGPATTPSVLVIDLAAGSARREPVLPLPGCAGCATAPSDG